MVPANARRVPDEASAPQEAAPPARARGDVLIIDDSAVARAALTRMVEAMPGFAVAAAVPGIAAALATLRSRRVDVMLLDLELPDMHGLDGLPDLVAAGEGARILVVSSAAGEGAVATLRALELGAADTLVKPAVGSFARQFAAVLEERMLRIVDAGARPAPQGLPRVSVAGEPDPVLGPCDVIAIGASTGGIHALSHVLRALTPEAHVPILVTQHLPPSFMPYYAAQLATLAGRPCDVAEPHMRVRPGRMILAPGTAHLRVVATSAGAAVRLDDEPQPTNCLPSVDPMFASVADVFGARAVGVVLSGMGRDGSIGAAALRGAGAPVLVQDRATSVVWGMPGSVAAAGHASAVLTPAAIGRVIAQAAGGGR